MKKKIITWIDCWKIKYKGHDWVEKNEKRTIMKYKEKEKNELH